MTSSKTVLNDLKEKGYKITNGRKAIIYRLYQQNSPITASKLLRLLHEQNIFLNKTTIYRELDFLVENHFVKELQFGERNKRYEIINIHHHHVICIKCKKVEKISSDILEDKLELLEQKIHKMGKFTDVNHSLEFYGLCKACQ